MTGYGGKTGTRYIRQIDSYLSYLHRSFDSNDKNDIKNNSVRIKNKREYIHELVSS